MLGSYLEFYKSVTGHSHEDGPRTNTILTGHSLGGGLAGFVSALSGTEGVGFDHMPFGAAALVQKFKDSLPENEQDLSISQIIGKVFEFYNDPSSRPELGEVNFRGVSVLNEILEGMRDGSIPLWGATGVGAAEAALLLLSGRISSANWLENGIQSITNENISALLQAIQDHGGLAAYGNVSSSLMQELDSLRSLRQDFLDPAYKQNAVSNLPARALELHMNEYLVLLEFSKQISGGSDSENYKEKELWREIAEPLWGSYFDEDIAILAGFGVEGEEGNYSGGSAAPRNAMGRAIAYSALDGTNGLVFGNTGIRALFDDANELGRLVKNEQLNLSDSSIEQITKLVTQFAAQMALQEVDYLSLTGDGGENINFAPQHGILSFYKDGKAVLQRTDTDETLNADILSINFDQSLWDLTGDNYNKGELSRPLSEVFETDDFRDFLREVFEYNEADYDRAWLKLIFENGYDIDAARRDILEAALKHRFGEFAAEGSELSLVEDYFDKLLIELEPSKQRQINETTETKSNEGKSSLVQMESDTASPTSIVNVKIEGSNFNETFIAEDGNVDISGGHGANVLFATDGHYRFFDAISTDADATGIQPTLTFDDTYFGSMIGENAVELFHERWENGASVSNGSDFDNALAYDVYAKFLDPTTLRDKGVEVTKVVFGKGGAGFESAIELDIKDQNTNRVSKDRLFNIDRVVLSQRADTVKVQDNWLASPIALDLGNYAEDGIDESDYDLLSFADLSHGIDMVNGVLAKGSSSASAAHDRDAVYNRILTTKVVAKDVSSVDLKAKETPLRFTGFEDLEGTNFGDIFVLGRKDEFAKHLGKWREPDTPMTHGQVDAKDGDDTIFVYDFKFIEKQSKIEPSDGGTTFQAEEDSLGQSTAKTDLYSVVDGGAGDDWIMARGGERVVTLGGAGRDWIFNTSKGGVVYGDTYSSTIESLDAQGLPVVAEVPDSDENSDKIWFWGGTAMMDPDQHDYLAFFGLPLVGGTSGIPLWLNVATGGGGLFLGLSLVGDGGRSGIYFDELVPFIVYSYDQDAQKLTVYNSVTFTANKLAKFAGLGSGEDAIGPDGEAIPGGAMVFHNYDDFSSGLFGWDLFNVSNGVAVPRVGDLAMNFKQPDALIWAALKVLQNVLGSTTVGWAASAGLQLIPLLDLYYSTVNFGIKFGKNIAWAKFEDPLILDLDGDGIETIQQSFNGVKFDHDGDGFKELSGWLSGDDGFLALDKNGNRRIDDINELFGNVGLSGIDELAQYDSNSDGIIDGLDTVFKDLLVWQDLDQDGETDEGELNSLEDLGIVSFNLDRLPLDVTTPQGTRLEDYIRFTFDDSTVRLAYDAFFEINNAITEFAGETGIAAWLQNDDLVNMNGFGTIADLAIDLSNDFELAEIVARDAAAMVVPDLEVLRQQASATLSHWAQSLELSRELTPVLTHTDANGTALVARAVYVEDASGGYWTLHSGAAILDADGAAIDRPTLEDVLAQTTSADQTWALEQAFSPTSRSEDLQHREAELLSNLVFEDFRSCGALVLLCGFNSIIEFDAGDDFGKVAKAA